MRFFLETDGGRRDYFSAPDRAAAVETVRGWYAANRSPLTDTPDGSGGFCPKFCEVWDRAECIVRFVRNPIPRGATGFDYLTIVYGSWAQTVHLTDARLTHPPTIPAAADPLAFLPGIVVVGGPTDIHGRPVHLPPDDEPGP
jgi:hypothetical protein